jgi:transcriptional antiterminator Rof (Rho-off)
VSPYHPVSCALYDALALAALRREAVLLYWEEAEGHGVRAEVIVEDIFSDREAEWLRFRPLGERRDRVVRLDRIRYQGCPLGDRCA